MAGKREWLVGMLGRRDVSRQLKSAVVELLPLVGTNEVDVCTVEEARERLDDAHPGGHVCLVWGPPPIDTESAG